MNELTVGRGGVASGHTDGGSAAGRAAGCTSKPPSRVIRHRTLLESARWFLHGGRHDAKLARLTASPLGRGMSVRQLVTLAATADIVTLPAGTTAVIGPGGRFVHRVLSGRVAAAEGGSILDVFAAGTRLSPGDEGGVILALEDSELIVISPG